MKPKSPASAFQGDLFEGERISIISLQHPLGKLAALILWDDCERQPQATYPATTGAPFISTRLMAARYILKFQQDLSDDDVVAAWVEKSLLAVLWRNAELISCAFSLLLRCARENQRHELWVLKTALRPSRCQI
jgi:hypothetical protein